MSIATLLGRSLWSETERQAAPHPPLQGALQIDVAVVGGGITGLTCALLLQREGRRVALLEADRLGAGTTGETSAQVTSVPELGYAALIRRVGRGGAAAFVAATRAALESMESLHGRSLIPNGWARVPAYVFTESEADVSLLESEVEAARELGVAATFSRTSPLPFPVEGAVLYPGQARFHPLDYLQGLAAQLRENGGRIFEGTRVTSFEEQGPSVVVHTDRGTVTAASLVLATHVPLGLNLVQVEVAPYRSYVVVLELRGPLPDALFWDTAKPYHYFRRCHAGKPLLLLGGEDHKAGQDPDPVERYERLEEFARVHFNVRAAVCRWASQYYEPADGLPYVGRSPMARNIYISTGYSGNGLVTGTLAAQALTDLLQGRESEMARQLSATRLPLENLDSEQS